MLCYTIYLQVVKVHLFNYSISRVSYVHSSRTTDESLHFWKSKYFRKPKRIRAPMPTSTSKQSLKDLSYDQILFAKICRRNFEIRRRVLRVKKWRNSERTHTHLDPPMHFDFPERMCMHQSLSLSLSLFTFAKTVWIQIRPEWNSGKLKKFAHVIESTQCRTKADAHDKIGYQYISISVYIGRSHARIQRGSGGPDPPPPWKTTKI